jgi:hypothetical protein
VLKSWPGRNAPVVADTKGDYKENLSGLEYVAGVNGKPDMLYGISNGPSNLFR